MAMGKNGNQRLSRARSRQSVNMSDFYKPIPRRKALTVIKPSTKLLVYTPEIAEKIAYLYAVEGLTLKAISQLPGMPSHHTIMAWQFKNKDFSDLMDDAFIERAKNWAREIVDIADNAEQSLSDPRHTKNRIVARQWIAERLLPKLYGSKTYVNHSGEINLGIAERLLKAKDLLDLRKNIDADREHDIIDVTPVEHGSINVSRETQSKRE